MYSLAVLSSLLAAVASAAPQLSKRVDTWGGALSLGPTTSHIIRAETTLIPGESPPSQTGELFLWPGMSNGTGDLIQTTLEHWYHGNGWCNGVAGQWCVRASLFGSFGQLDGPPSPVNGSDQVHIEYVNNDDGVTWSQYVTNAVTGQNLSTFTHESGRMTGYGTGTECDDGCTPTISEQRYINTTITLASADKEFGKTLGVSGGTTYTGLSVSDDGTVWTIDEILIPAMT